MHLIILAGAIGYRIHGGWLAWLFAPLGRKLPQRLLWAAICGAAALAAGGDALTIALTAVGGFAGCWIANGPPLQRPEEFDLRGALLTAAGGGLQIALLAGPAAWSSPVVLAVLALSGAALRLAAYRVCWLVPVPARWLGTEGVPVDDHPAWAEMAWGGLMIGAVLGAPTLAT